MNDYIFSYVLYCKRWCMCVSSILWLVKSMGLSDKTVLIIEQDLRN